MEEEEQEEVTPPARATTATSRGRGLPPVAPISSSSTSRSQKTMNTRYRLQARQKPHKGENPTNFSSYRIRSK